MRRKSFLAVLFIIIVGIPVVGQDATPAISQPVPTPTPFVSDVQKARPENLAGVPPIATDYKSVERGLPDLGRVGVDMLTQRPMSLDEALELALENNRDIEVTRQNMQIADFDLASARGFYQSRLSGQSYYERSTTPNISFFTPETTKVTNRSIVANGAFTKFFPKYGSQFTATLANNDLDATNPIAVLGRQFNSLSAATLTQPLFRGRSIDQQRRVIEIAKRNISLTDAQFRQRTIEVVAGVERAYWDLTYALRNLMVQKDSLRDAQEQVEHNRRLVKEGQLAPVDIIASETQVANLEQGLYDALNTVNQAENVLKSLISPNKDAAIWAESITPVESVELRAPTMTLAEAVNTALQNRPELEVNAVQREINEVDRRFFKDQTKPQVDLIASYTSQGIGGALNRDFTNPLLRGCVAGSTQPECIAAFQAQQRLLETVGGRASSFADMLQNKYPTFRVGVSFNFPLFGDKTAEAQYGRALVEGRRIDTQREQIEQTVQVDVRNAMQFIRTSEARLRAASIARENSERQYLSEQRKLDEGQSDVYRVLERQTAHTVARSNELRARTDLNKAIVDFNKATGNSLQAHNIKLVR